jgi:hypothetical protein
MRLKNNRQGYQEYKETVRLDMETQLNTHEYIIGKIDGEKDAKSRYGWFGIALFFGFIIVIIAIFYNEKPKIDQKKDEIEDYIRDDIVGQTSKSEPKLSDDYMLGFREAFYDKAKTYSIVYAITGTIVSYIFIGILVWLRFFGE